MLEREPTLRAESGDLLPESLHVLRQRGRATRDSSDRSTAAERENRNRERSKSNEHGEDGDDQHGSSLMRDHGTAAAPRGEVRPDREPGAQRSADTLGHTMDLVVAALTFGTVFLVELPDKTFIATLVLSTRFRPLLVWLGVGIAFALQTAIAVGLGQAVSLLPVTWVRGGAAVLFLAGAFLLLREARNADSEEADTEAEFAARADRTVGTSGRRTAFTAVLTSFLVLFAAEWGDLSQLLILSLAAKYDAPLSVFAGALAGLLAVSGLAVLLGRWLLARIKLRTLHYIGGGMCLLLAGLTLGELLT